MAVRKFKVGQKYGRLTVINAYAEPYGTHWKHLCRCECGTEKLLLGHAFRSGDTKSCGCLQRSANGNPMKPYGIRIAPEDKDYLSDNSAELLPVVKEALRTIVDNHRLSQLPVEPEAA